MPGFQSLPPEELAALVRFIRPPPRRWSGLSMPRWLSGRQYSSRGYKRLLDPDGYPASKPPWGTLNAIDLQSGRLVWTAPLGEYPELTARGIPKTGTGRRPPGAPPPRLRRAW